MCKHGDMELIFWQNESIQSDWVQFEVNIVRRHPKLFSNESYFFTDTFHII